MTPSPTLKVLSAMRGRRVRCLLMGGQACVLYGGAEFSRDTDIAVLADEENIGRLREALNDLRADCIAVPPLELDYLARGHAVHFRCSRPDAAGMRVYVMSRMRGVAPFHELWERRTTIQLEEGTEIELLGLADLVQAKKTQRDKDWLMLRRLLEADYAAHRRHPGAERISFWFRELRTPELIIELAGEHPADAQMWRGRRGAVDAALEGDVPAAAAALQREEAMERDADRSFWAPLRRELEALRRASLRK